MSQTYVVHHRMVLDVVAWQSRTNALSTAVILLFVDRVDANSSQPTAQGCFAYHYTLACKQETPKIEHLISPPCQTPFSLISGNVTHAIRHHDLESVTKGQHLAYIQVDCAGMCGDESRIKTKEAR